MFFFFIFGALSLLVRYKAADKLSLYIVLRHEWPKPRAVPAMICIWFIKLNRGALEYDQWMGDRHLFAGFRFHNCYDMIEIEVILDGFD